MAMKWMWARKRLPDGRLVRANALVPVIVPREPKVETPRGLLRAARAEAKHLRKAEKRKNDARQRAEGR